MTTCQFCNGIFSTKTSLYIHQKKAKYCLEKQGKQVDEFPCKQCCKIFYSKRYLQNHQIKCNIGNKLEDLNKIIESQKETIVRLTTIIKERQSFIEDLKTQNKDLAEKLQSVAIKGATKSTNTNILRLENLTDEHLQKCAKLLRAEHITDVSSLAKFAADHSFKDRVIATDHSRKTLAFKKDGKVVKDHKGKQLAIKFFSSIKDQNITKAVQDQIFAEIGNVSDTERQELFDQMDVIMRIEKGTLKISQGEEHELKQEFINRLCEIIPNQE